MVDVYATSGRARRVQPVTVATGMSRRTLLSARNAVLGTLFLTGVAFATFASRIPSVRQALDLGPGRLGLLLLATSAGAVLALPSSGGQVQRLGGAPAVTVAAVVEGVGLTLVATGAGVIHLILVTAVGLFLVGFGTGTW